MRHGSYGIVIAASLAIVGPATVVTARDTPAAPLEKGAFYGRVIDTTTGKPIPDATVAIRDRSGTVVAWSKTDADGRYTVAADTLTALQLRPSRHRNLLQQFGGTVHKVVTFPGKVAETAVVTTANVVKATAITGIGDTAKSVIASAATGSPGPIGARIVGNTVNAIKQQAPQQARGQAIATALGERQANPKNKRKGLLPGEVQVEVTAAGYKSIKSADGAYWLEAPSTVSSQPVGPQAWLEQVKLAPAASDKKSTVEDAAVLLSEPAMDPAMATPGSTIKLTVKLQMPPEPKANLRVFAREQKKEAIVELKPTGPGTFAGDLVLDPKTPIGDTTISIAALRAEPIEVKLQNRNDDPLLAFAGKVEDLDGSKPYEYDPRIYASENRLDLPLTILDPKAGTPPGTPPAPAAKAPASPAPAAKPPAPGNAAPGTPAPAALTTPAPAAPTTPAPATPAPATPAPAAPAAPSPAAPSPAAPSK